MKKLFSILSVLSVIAMLTMRCKKDDKPVPPEVEEPKPMASFTYTKPDTAKFLEYQFTGIVKNAKEILWQFGDDSTSVEVSPFHKYAYEGDYHVVLSVRNSQGYWASKEVLLNVVDPSFDKTKVGENYFLTVGGTLTVSRDNGNGPNSGEGSLKVVDGKSDTKFFQSGFSGDLVMKFELNTVQVAGAYTLISANDSPDRDPKTWSLQGSEDGIKWITLDSRTNITFASRFERKLYHFNNNVAYKSYRLNVKANNGSRDFQMAEWTVNKKQP
ncbi:PKD domain-containing protein [Mucilaginibacter pocheonensis]|uniref:PKD repeat protein n=1 Tax=Mucilaginibacter pocheonensis TaxID=398050 RepID=A0ABU1T843_9SPHI|nr:PKD domain-containing protein [Mucilaginibacter pocheonensis]MDR6941026.1 PKD repeat protein [Mucilaginibacter pocheonensis]